MLATDLESMNLGIIVHEFIMGEIIPKLKDKILRENKESEKKELEDLLALYFKYANPRSQEGKLYDTKAVQLMQQMGKSLKIQREDMEDLMQDIAVDFYRQGSKLGADLRDVLLRFNEMDGPIKLCQFWGKILYNRLSSVYRDKIKTYKEKSVGFNLDKLHSQNAPVQIDEKVIQGLIGGLQEYIRSKVSKPEIKDMVGLWVKMAQDHEVNMKRDIYPKIIKKYGTPESTLAQWWRNTQTLIVRYFVDELEMKDKKRVRELIHLGAVEAVTYMAYKKELSKWIVGSLLYAKLYGKK